MKGLMSLIKLSKEREEQLLAQKEQRDELQHKIYGEAVKKQAEHDLRVKGVEEILASGGGGAAVTALSRTYLLDALSLNRQEGGSHYKDCAIQPLEYIEANNLSFPEGNIIKYVTRRKGDRVKGDRLKDLKKARHYLDYLIELEEKFLSWNKHESEPS